ncbi:MAG: Fatty acid metabolism regulator protein [Firmicutes bacterium]|nr:Fatty acid metabolism regulator protein [candidate division NPL-UPA2 bacterium]
MNGNSGYPERATGVQLPKTARGQVTFDKLIKAAEKVIGESGYHEASVSAITQAAEVGMGTFYLYFRTKKDIFRELIYYIHHDLRRFIQIAVAGIADRKDAEVLGIQAFYRYCLEHPHLYAIIREAEFVDYEIFRWHYSNFARGYAGHLRAAMIKGQVKQLDPEMLAYCLIGISVFTGMRWPCWEGKLPSKEEIDTLREFILSGISPA